MFRICGIGSKTLPERLKPQSTKIKELWGALQALREFRNTLQGCDITFFTDNVGVVKLLGTGNWADASLPKCVANIVPVMETLHVKVEHLPNTSDLLNFVDQISRNKLRIKNEFLKAVRTQAIENVPKINIKEIVGSQSLDDTCAKIIKECKKIELIFE